MKKAIIINDTTNELHHGCEMVIFNIKKLLKTNGIEVIGSNLAGFNWRSNKELLNKMKERAVKASGHVQANPYLAGLLQDERDANVDTNVDTNKALATGAAANRSFKYMSPASIMEARRARSGTGGKSKKKRRRRRRRTRR